MAGRRNSVHTGEKTVPCPCVMPVLNINPFLSEINIRAYLFCDVFDNISTPTAGSPAHSGPGAMASGLFFGRTHFCEGRVLQSLAVGPARRAKAPDRHACFLRRNATPCWQTVIVAAACAHRTAREPLRCSRIRRKFVRQSPLSPFLTPARQIPCKLAKYCPSRI